MDQGPLNGEGLGSAGIVQFFPVCFSWKEECSFFFLQGGSDGKESACNVGDLGSIPGSEDPLEKGMATHSSILAGEFHGQRSLAGYSPWGRKESDTTEWLSLTHAEQCSVDALIHIVHIRTHWS